MYLFTFCHSLIQDIKESVAINVGGFASAQPHPQLLLFSVTRTLGPCWCWEVNNQSSHVRSQGAAVSGASSGSLPERTESFQTLPSYDHISETILGSITGRGDEFTCLFLVSYSVKGHS